MESSLETVTHLQHQDELFSLALTKEQAKFLKNLLPLNYSLHLASNKRAKKIGKKGEKGMKRSNLPVTSVAKECPEKNGEDNDSRETGHERQNLAVTFDKAKTAKEVEDEETCLTLGNRKEQRTSQYNDPIWIAHFLKELYSYPSIKRAFGQFFDQLKEKLARKSITQLQFKKAIEKMLEEQEPKPKKQNRAAQTIEKIRIIFVKHLKGANNSKSTAKTASLAKQASRSKATKKSPEKKGDTVAKKRELLTARKKTGSQTSSELGFDFDLNEVNVKPTVIMDAAKTHVHLLDAGYISRNLRKIPNGEALKLLKRYGVNVLDILKIKALSKANMQELKQEVKALKGKYSDLTDSSQDKQEYVESSFEIEDE